MFRFREVFISLIIVVAATWSFIFLTVDGTPQDAPVAEQDAAPAEEPTAPVDEETDVADVDEPVEPEEDVPAAPAEDDGPTFAHYAPGDLIEGSGSGLKDYNIYVEGMRFPIEAAPAFANSQVYNAGGMYGDTGGQCAAGNYEYPWRDNFCESRSRQTDSCPAGTGHQGQDIRAQSCDDAVHHAVATEDGFIWNIGSYTVTLATNDGSRIYRYMHLDMDSLEVAEGDEVTQGQRLGKVSNDFGGSATTIHLHFELKQNIVLSNGTQCYCFVSPFMSLVKSYETLIGGKGFEIEDGESYALRRLTASFRGRLALEIPKIVTMYG